MLRNLFSLSVQGTLRKRRSSALVFFVLLLSFSCALMSLSLTASISRTNEEYRYGVYGAWYLALIDGKDADADYLAQQNWAQEVGSARVYGKLANGDAIGTLDENALSLSRIELLDGRLPEKEGEIALTKSALTALRRREAQQALGILDDTSDAQQRTLLEEAVNTYTLGESISVAMTFHYVDFTPADETAQASAHSVEYNYSTSWGYTLVGVLNDYADMWALENSRTRARPLGAVVTAEEAQNLWSTVDEYVCRVLCKGGDAEDGIDAPAPQYFVRVAPESYETAQRDTASYLLTSRDVISDELKPSCNDLAYPAASGSAPEADTLYSLLIAAVALVAVLCVYMMQLQSEVHSFAVLRSVGITKGQLLVLMGLESLLLAVPAMLLGVPLGALLTRLALHLLMYAGSTTVQVAVPYEQLWLLLALWLGVIAVSRLVIFLVTVRTPLTGRMQLSSGRARRVRRARSALIVLLLAAFGATLVYTVVNANRQELARRELELSPGYRISERESRYASFISAEWLERLKSFPGVLDAEGFCDNMEVYLSYAGMDGFKTGLWVIEPENWAESFDFGRDREAFEAGELVYLCFPEELRGQDELYTLPGDTIRLRTFYNGECAIDYTAEVKVKWLPADMITRRLYSSFARYQVVGSTAFFEKLLDSLPEGGHWYRYSKGDGLCFEWILVTVDMNMYREMSTNRLLESFCVGLSTNNRTVTATGQQSQYYTQRQLILQQLILLYACGGCIATVTLLLLASALALEAEQERRSFTILRVIGMSNRQMRRRVAGKATARSVFAAASGWMLYALLAIREKGTDIPFREAAAAAWRSYRNFGGSTSLIWQLSLAMLAVLLAVSLFSKRGLKQGTLLK